MSNYDDLLREKEKSDIFDDSSIEKHWAVMENKMDTHIHKPRARYRKIFITVISVAAVLVVAFFVYTLFKEKPKQTRDMVATVIRSSIMPPLNGANLPYETFSFDVATGDTLFTLNGSIIIFPKNAVLNSKGEKVTGNIEVRAREFNDPFDYSIAGIPMDYDSAGVRYQFISSAMIDITAYKNGEPLQVNPGAKPQLNLVSTNKERKTNLYKLDTVSGKWTNKGIDEVNLVGLRKVNTDSLTQEPIYDDVVQDYIETEPPKMPAPPQKASNVHPLIDVIVDPASFKELLVYDGLKFEVIDANTNTVGEDSKMEWDNIELIRGAINGTYKVVFSARNKKVTYNVKPVLHGKDFEEAEKLYQDKLKEYTRIQLNRKKNEAEDQRLSAQLDLTEKEQEEDNKRMEELNKLIVIRNKFIETENIRIDALNRENQKRRDSIRKARSEQLAKREQYNRIADLQQNLIRSFEIDGFGYWNCDMPSLPATQPYVVNFKNAKNEVVTFNTLCIAATGINRIQNYYNTNNIALIKNSEYFGWAYNANQVFYFTKKDFKNAVKVNNTITIAMNLYDGDLKDYSELKVYIFKVNSNNDVSKK